jgi:2,2-dialkylglycine decarboxylase (pyruvate)
MKTFTTSNSLDLWRRSGENLLVLQPFMDSLIVRGDGCYMIDADGNRILDLAAGQFCSILGHSHTRFTERLKQQLDEILHLGDQFVTPGVLEAASRLVGVAPGNLKKVVFLSTGSEANECAMRMAKAVSGRTGMLAFSRGYYGISLATRNLSSISDHPGKFDFQPVPSNQHKLLTPICHRCPIQQTYPSCNTACLDVSLEMISQYLENVAAVIVEPILSAGGMILPPKDYLQKLHKAAHEHGALFIVDEAQTGFGRCGKWFDIENYEIEPDIMVVSKTGGNGYPFAAVVVSAEIAEKLEDRCFTHLSSHQNDPLAAATIKAVIDIVEEENLIDNSSRMGAYFTSALENLKRKHSIVADVRGRGLMIGMELSSDEGANADLLAFRFAMLCEKRGVHITFSYFEPVVRMIPPLIISQKEIDQAVSVMDEALTLLKNDSIQTTELLPQNCRSGPVIKEMMSPSFSKKVRKIWTTSPQQWVEKVNSFRQSQ